MRRMLIMAVVLALAGLPVLASPATAQPSGPAVEVFGASGVLDRSLLGALRDAVEGGPERGARVLLVQLDSFGGLGVDAAEVQRLVAEADVPVAVWVGPRQARASGAAAFLLAGADVVAASRDARIGPALPAELGRGAGAEPGLFDRSGLPPPVERGVIDGSRAEALGLADYQAESLPDVVERLDGRGADGATLDMAGFPVRFLSRSLLDRVLHGLANPTLAYLMLLAAACCLAFEWFQPGFGVAGVAGVLIAVLAVYSLAVLPTNWLALAALLAGTALFAVDTALAGLGLGTLAATALTGAGSWWLFSSSSPLLRVDGRLALLGTAWMVLYFVVVLTVVLRSQRRAPMATDALVGAHGVVRSVLNPGGIVVIDGAVWRAELDGGGSLPNGQRVRVERVDGGTLKVVPEDPTALRPGKKRRASRV